MQTHIPIVSQQLSAHLDTVARRFVDTSEELQYYELGQGNINDTFLVVSAKSTFILQRINGRVFAEPGKVAHNSVMVSSYIHNGIAKSRGLKIPWIIKTSAGENCFIDGKGETWRAQSFIADSRVYDRVGSPSQAFQVGRCLALFHQGVDGLALDIMEEVLPDFHNLPRYLEKYDNALADSPVTVSPELRYCLDAVSRQRKAAFFFENAVDRGDIVPQVVHGDPKISNFLFDKKTGEAVAMIDLDTVGPGLILYDIGDCLRSCCCPTAEQDRDAVICDTAIVEAVLSGYRGERMLEKFEGDHVYDALLLVTFELGVRFVTDYLQGNRYFKVSGPEDNLHRAMVQFHLLESIASQRRIIEKMVTAGAKRTKRKR